MKKIFLFSLFLLLGLFGSQAVPTLFDGESYHAIKEGLDLLLLVCLSFIMINVGREFDLDKSRWRNYTTDYFIAMATAAGPWLIVALYYMFILPDGSFSNWEMWKENLLLSRFAAPTSAGILFTMLAAAKLKRSWVYQKTQVLAIFDDLDTILLMIPLQIMMIGMKWQLLVVVAAVFGFLYFGWSFLNKFTMSQRWHAILSYSLILVAIFEGIYVVTNALFGLDGAIHIEVLLPAFVLGMVMNTTHYKFKIDVKVADFISYFFMFLVGMSSPSFFNDGGEVVGRFSYLASVPAMEWKEILTHVLIVTLLSNIGKMFPMLAYRDKSLKERLALSVGMFTRGEVGAGIIFIAIGYNIGGPLLIISLLSIVANLLLTAFFVVAVKQLAVSARRDKLRIEKENIRAVLAAKNN